MRILVTGANGFVGRHFVDSAIAAGHDVVALQRKRSSSVHTPTAGTVRYADILDRAAVEAAISDVDCVCHLAAAFTEAADDDYFHRVNVDGTANILAAAHAAGVQRFVYCSTAGIYGKCVPGVVDETHSPQPWNGYERSKVAAEEEVRQRAAEYGMDYVILRPTQVYGPGDTRLSKLWRNASRGRFPLFGAGEGRRHMVYVGDVAEALLRACTYPGAANQELIIAGPEAAPLREILQTLAQVSNRRSTGPRLPLKPMVWLAGMTEDVCHVLKIKPPLHRRRMDFYISDAEFDCRRAREVLGWVPKVPLRNGIEMTLKTERVVPAPVSAAAQGSVWIAKAAIASQGLDAAQPYLIFV